MKISVVGEFNAMFFLVMLKKMCRTSKDFAGSVDPRRYWSYGASSIMAYFFLLFLLFLCHQNETLDMDTSQ